jgi:hypothetical protein
MKDCQIQEIGSKYRVRVRKDELGDYIIVGKYGQIYEYDPTCLGVIVSAPTGHRWKEARRKMLAAGFQHNQNGDCEGSCLFPADNIDLLKLALALIKAFKSRKGRVFSEKQLAHHAEFGRQARIRAQVNGQDSISRAKDGESPVLAKKLVN